MLHKANMYIVYGGGGGGGGGGRGVPKFKDGMTFYVPNLNIFKFEKL